MLSQVLNRLGLHLHWKVGYLSLYQLPRANHFYDRMGYAPGRGVEAVLFALGFGEALKEVSIELRQLQGEVQIGNL